MKKPKRHPITEKMSLYNVSGWVALLGAIELVDAAAEARGTNFDTLLKMKPEVLGDYVADRHDDVFSYLTNEAIKNKISPAAMAKIARKTDPKAILEDIVEHETHTR